ncbi:MAG: hypothetical protein LBL86_01155 [Coriobacteriales bacterium]|jgi:hypothetical protein|nr:hypothetical protein [Coriobacteriales bacterium]
MSVELAVCIPVVLALVAVSFNVMVFLGECARFDRMAAEVVRSAATSPAAGGYGLASSRERVEQALEEMLEGQADYLRPSVRAYALGSDGSPSSRQEGPSFALVPHQEVYICTLEYRPWGFGNSFFGVRFSGVTHTRSFTIDPFRPGALL